MQSPSKLTFVSGVGELAVESGIMLRKKINYFCEVQVP